MKVVLDTNVYVSAFIKPSSPPGRILDALVAARFDVVLSDAILNEVTGVLDRPQVARYLRRPPLWTAEFLVALRRAARLVEPTIVRAVAADPADDLILGTAIAGAADYLVSGNNHLLDLGSFQGIPIVTPRQFLDILALSDEPAP